jgi:tRNA(fMet)-specific endonuclease VapC
LALILADTDVLIDYLKGIQAAAERIRSYAALQSLCTSAVSCFELLSGADQGKQGEEVRLLVSTLPVLPLDLESAARAAGVRRNLAARGLPIGMGDSLVAGIALANGLHLLTRNRKHFQQVEGLHLVSLDH